MYKRMKFLVPSVVMSLSMMTALPVSAAEISTQVRQEEIQLMYVDTNGSIAKLSISSGQAICSAKVTNQQSKVLKITMYLQKNVSGAWKTVRTWSGSKTGTIYSLRKTAAVSKGKYRVKAVMKSGTESVTKYSSTVTY